MGTIKRKLASVSKECVACGSCVKVCPKEAITIYKGLFAKVDSEKCIGCTRCQKVCPASVITMIEREGI